MRYAPPQFFAPLAAALAPLYAAEVQGDVVTVADQAEFNAHLTKVVMQGGDSFRFRLAPDCKTPGKKIMRHSNWYDYAIAYRYSRRDGVYTLLAHFNPQYRGKLAKREAAALSRLEDRLAKLIRPGMSDAEKVRVLHDDLVRRVTYDIPSGGDCATIILTDKGLCEAYARYMFLALKISGVDCRIVLGKAGCPHAWNMVRINGHWCHMDATWDDPLSLPPSLRHDYFCISDRAMAMDHRWSTDAYPPAPEMDTHYFKTLGRYFTNYADFWKAVAAAHANGQTSFEAKLTPLAKKRRAFPKALQEFQAQHPEVRVEYYSFAATDRAVVFLSFVPKEDTRPVVKPAERDVPRPQGDGSLLPDWLDAEAWKDLCPDFNSDALLEEGRRLLDDAGEKGRELLEDGAENWRKIQDSVF